ncbi:hypothetical protein HRE53_18405 [Acaryochloris sp. 'Moss Beach']|uniref:hypothetical protein n=1 Tax=Acaryochloris sp. 'Moss Beach' TaxID=2740837 RepID=UPI001F25BF33|nr:hypothetical protein [Acaryochloris sp. 'Moss Beach']UJB68484.1 hypothetical protein HRE53_18405 [Acaryochloris sp. 'Moss Beach']
MMSQRNDWCGVPLDYLQEWDRIFIASKDSLNLSAPCPICKAVALHRWYQVGQPKLQTVGGNTFVATGGLWEWCSSCRSFEHLSALVPEWWACDLKVDEAALTAKPTAIEEAMKAQGYRLDSE